jgi:glycosyltransferase involved in cell wall biosynthesis
MPSMAGTYFLDPPSTIGTIPNSADKVRARQDAPVRVTLLTEQLRHRVPGGIGTYVRGLQQGLAELRPPDAAVTPWQSRLPPSLRAGLWERGIGRLGGDVVHAPSFAFPAVRSRLVMMVHDLAWRDVPETFPRRGRAWHERALRRALRSVDRFVVPSEPVRDSLVAAGAEDDRVDVIAEGSDHLPPPDAEVAARVVRGDYILTVSTRQPRKNLARLAAAFAQARPEFSAPVSLVVVGPEGWGDDEPLGDVVLAGRVDDATLAGLYQGARAVAYVPLLEGFGLPPVEAMRAGVPVVTSTAVPSGIGASLAVEATDSDAIAGALVAVVNDEAVRNDLVEKGRARASELTWRNAAARHVDVWRSVAT